MPSSDRRRRSEWWGAAFSMLAVLLAVTALRAPAAAPENTAGAIEVEASRVPLDPADPNRKTLGPLRYLGGLWLRSEEPRFGGLSDLRLSRDGRELAAISDCGHGFTAHLHYDVDGQLVGLGDARLVPLTDSGGLPLTRDASDAESLMAVGAEELDVGFEGTNSIRAYGPDFAGPGRLLGVPDGLDQCGSNTGLELMADMGDGRRLLVCEGRRHASITTPAWIGSGDSWQPREYPLKFDGGVAGEPFRPTGAARLPNGDMLTLERRFPPLSGRLVRIPRATLEGTGLLQGSEVARIEPPLTADNFEGVEVLRDARGRTLVYLISDDNGCEKNQIPRKLNPQRTLLLQFALGD